MFRLQVTIITQTFQYMDMTCSLFTVWGSVLFTFGHRTCRVHVLKFLPDDGYL